jgi:hypothetical protein
MPCSIIPNGYNSMWIIQPEPEYEKKAKRWPNKYRREFSGVHDNLDALMMALNCGAKVEEAVKRGFIHAEPRGVVAIDQGGGKGLKETRLYVYLDKVRSLAYLITIGDKNSQKVDIQYASEFVDSITRNLNIA